MLRFEPPFTPYPAGPGKFTFHRGLFGRVCLFCDAGLREGLPLSPKRRRNVGCMPWKKKIMRLIDFSRHACSHIVVHSSIRSRGGTKRPIVKTDGGRASTEEARELDGAREWRTPHASQKRHKINEVALHHYIRRLHVRLKVLFQQLSLSPQWSLSLQRRRRLAAAACRVTL